MGFAQLVCDFSVSTQKLCKHQGLICRDQKALPLTVWFILKPQKHNATVWCDYEFGWGIGPRMCGPFGGKFLSKYQSKGALYLPPKGVVT